MRYIVILESPLLIPHIHDLTANAEEVICLLNEAYIESTFRNSNIKTYNLDPAQKETYLKLEIQPEDRVILYAETGEMTEKVLTSIFAVC